MADITMLFKRVERKPDHLFLCAGVQLARYKQHKTTFFYSLFFSLWHFVPFFLLYLLHIISSGV